MTKRTIYIIIAAVVIILISGGAYIYQTCTVKALTEQRQEIEAKIAEMESEKQKLEETKAEAEQTAEQTEVEEVPTEENETISYDELPEHAKEQLKIANKEIAAIKEMLTAYNKAQNEYDYRTMTGREGMEYMAPEFAEFYEEHVPKIKKQMTEEKVVRKFEGIKVKQVAFTAEDYKSAVREPGKFTHAYIELEIRARDVEPVEEYTNFLCCAWVRKIDGQWKVSGEDLLEKLD